MMKAKTEMAAGSGRLMSLDALRGFDMFFIMGLPALIVAVSVLCGLGKDWWLCAQMKHVTWHGWHLMDGVFPTFLFVAGISWPFSCASRRAKGATNRDISLSILRRMLSLFLLGCVCEGIMHVDLGWECFRFGSVLCRTGLAWGAAAFLYAFCGMRTRIIFAAAVLAGYWLLLLNVTAPDAAQIAAMPPATQEIARTIAEFGTDSFSLPGCISGWVDRTILPGRLRYVGILDTQGTLSTFPAICFPLFGTMAGEWVRRKDVNGNRKAILMLAAAALFALLGWTLAHWLGPGSTPFNRSIWTSSHILWSTGYALSLFAVFYWIIYVKMWRRWTLFFRVIGMNAIVIWMLTHNNRVGSHGNFTPLRDCSRWLFGGLAGVCPPEWGALVSAGGYIAVCWAFLYVLYRKGIFLKA